MQKLYEGTFACCCLIWKISSQNHLHKHHSCWSWFIIGDNVSWFVELRSAWILLCEYMLHSTNEIEMVFWDGWGRNMCFLRWYPQLLIQTDQIHLSRIVQFDYILLKKNSESLVEFGTRESIIGVVGFKKTQNSSNSHLIWEIIGFVGFKKIQNSANSLLDWLNPVWRELQLHSRSVVLVRFPIISEFGS